MSNASSKPKLSPEPKQVADKWPHPILAVITVVGLFFVSQVVAAILLLMLAWALKSVGINNQLLGDGAISQFIYIFVAEGLVLSVLVAILKASGLGLGDIGLKRSKWTDPLFSILAYGLYFVLYVILVTGVSHLIPGLNLDQKQDIGFDNATGVLPLIAVFLALVVLAPVTEEILMRGFLFGSLRRKLSFWVTTLLTSIVFAGLHLGGGEQGAGLLWIAAIDTFILSLVLCYLREKTGRLWASIGLHALKNFVSFLALFIFTH